MHTSGTGTQYWKITEKLEMLLKLAGEFSERTLLILTQQELVCIIKFCSILSFGESHKLQWLSGAFEKWKIATLQVQYKRDRAPSKPSSNWDGGRELKFFPPASTPRNFSHVLQESYKAVYIINTALFGF